MVKKDKSFKEIKVGAKIKVINTFIKTFDGELRLSHHSKGKIKIMKDC